MPRVRPPVVPGAAPRVRPPVVPGVAPRVRPLVVPGVAPRARLPVVPGVEPRVKPPVLPGVAPKLKPPVVPEAVVPAEPKGNPTEYESERLQTRLSLSFLCLLRQQHSPLLCEDQSLGGGLPYETDGDAGRLA